LEKQAELETEFKVIAPLQKANRVGGYSTNLKNGQTLVSAKYLTKTNAQDTFKHYDEQLKQHGWQFRGTKKLIESDHEFDLDRSSAYYCKGDYNAVIRYARRTPNYDWTYTFGMSWDFYGCREP